jgi:uncharacterized protein (DUF1778 family)
MIMASRKKRKDVTKDISIHIRVTEDQKELLAEAANSLGIGLSAWLLSTAIREAQRMKSKNDA